MLTAKNEMIKKGNSLGITINQSKIPVLPAVQDLCEILGLDPLYVANEGKLVAIVPEAESVAVLEALRAHPRGKEAAVIGRTVEEHQGRVVANTAIGSSRIVDLPAGELLRRWQPRAGRRVRRRQHHQRRRLQRLLRGRRRRAGVWERLLGVSRGLR